MGISYPNWLKTFIMPYEYGEELLDVFFDYLSCHYVCNGCIYSGNYGFWYNEWSNHRFDPKEALQHSYSELPWQLILKNPLLSTEKYFNKIVKSIETNNTHACYFYKIDEYQELSQGQLEKLAELSIPKAVKSSESYEYAFLKKHFPSNRTILEDIKSKMTDNIYNVFWFARYPKYMVKEYILSKQCDISEKLRLAKSANIDEKEILKDIVTP
jgi:hypothetical protein